MGRRPKLATDGCSAQRPESPTPYARSICCKRCSVGHGLLVSHSFSHLCAVRWQPREMYPIQQGCNAVPHSRVLTICRIAIITVLLLSSLREIYRILQRCNETVHSLYLDHISTSMTVCISSTSCTHRGAPVSPDRVQTVSTSCAPGHFFQHSLKLGGGCWSCGNRRRWTYFAVGEPSKPAMHIIATAATLNQYPS